MNIDELSGQLKINPADLSVVVTRLNVKHKLHITDFGDMTTKQYQILRALLDEQFLVNLIGRGSSNRKYSYNHVANYPHVQTWISQQSDLDGTSTRAIKGRLPSFMKVSDQVLAAAMREAGYISVLKRLDGGKQGRRWRRAKPPVTFL
jgi:hypothetical protein